ncbi:nickel-binding protein [Aromatoleum diolicum]|uniref:DUF4242 domain-containing protein n=1 Tax=Aromatoleum diolicum TaxID=75796 RepID=A0ABX1Q9C6_9RHOO|nr:nickel-binding protein [Aromatoleum diolicum]NMG74993.1 DUF4242 domain-containing protein [Aromatoleum diolicum]
MVELFLERDFFPPVSHANLHAAWSGALDCSRMHRVEWRGSLLSLDGRKLVCNFRAPDAESVRIVLRSGGADVRRLWPGTVHDAPTLERFTADSANVLVRRSFAQPVEVADIQAREDAAAWCLDVRHVKFVRTCFSTDRTRMLCLYRAPDAESVREAQRTAAMPMDDVWGFTALLPDA